MKTFSIETPRLLLREWTTKDIPDGYTIWGDPEVMIHVDQGTPLSLAQVKEAILAGIKHQEKYGFQHWAVIEKQTEKLIGACGFNSTDEADVIELVFHFSRKSWGKGFSTESAKACVSFAVDQIKPLKIIAGCHPKNAASKRVLEKCGFSFVGNKWFEDTQREEPCYEFKNICG